MKAKKALLISIILTLVTYVYAYAQLKNYNLPDRKGVEAGPLIVHSAFSTEVQFDTNIFLSSEDAKYDTITVLSPSVGLELPLGDHNFSADYEVDFNFFGHYREQNYIDQRLRGLAEINLTNYTITLEDVYSRFSHRSGSEDTNRIKQQRNNLRVGAEAEFDQFAFDAGYTFAIEDYLSDQLLFQTMTYQDKDRVLNIVDLQVSYRFLPKTSVLLESYLGFINYDSSLSSDSYYTETLVGLEGDLFRRSFKINLKAGLRYQNYKEADITDSDDFLGPVARGGISYIMTEDDIFDLSVERSVYESTYADMNYYNVNYIGLKYTHIFNDKISANVSGSYQLNLYPSETTELGETEKRNDHFFAGGCSIRYNIRKWVTLEASYEYTQRESNFGNFDYIGNLFIIKGTVGF